MLRRRTGAQGPPSHFVPLSFLPNRSVRSRNHHYASHVPTLPSPIPTPRRPRTLGALHALARGNAAPSYARPDGLTSYVQSHLKDPSYSLPPSSLSQTFTVHHPIDFGVLAAQLRQRDVQTYFKQISVGASWQCSYNLRHNGGWAWDGASERWEEAKALAEEAGVRLSLDLGACECFGIIPGIYCTDRVGNCKIQSKTRRKRGALKGSQFSPRHPRSSARSEHPRQIQQHTEFQFGWKEYQRDINPSLCKYVRPQWRTVFYFTQSLLAREPAGTIK